MLELLLVLIHSSHLVITSSNARTSEGSEGTSSDAQDIK